MTFFEVLPVDCPLKDAVAVDSQGYYRLVGTIPVNDEDFYSHKKLGKWPAAFKTVPECIACSLSVWDSLDACNELKKLPLHKDKSIAAISLSKEDGVIKQTTKKINHHSWWRSASFQIDKNVSYP